MGRMKNSLVLMLFGIFISFQFGCTRTPATSTLRLSLPLSSTDGEQAQTIPASHKLGFAVFNIQLPGQGPKVYEFEFRDEDSANSTSAATPELVLDKVPTGSALIQFLGVYESSTDGLMIFRYGDVAHNIVAGDNLVTIIATSMGSSSKQYRSMGRLFTSNTGGPTGQMIFHIHPPNNRPKMNLMKYDILNGWFEIFHPGGGINVSYSLASTGETIFGPFTETSNYFSGIDDANSRTSRFEKPTSFRQGDDGRVESATEFKIGFFKTPTASPVDFSSKYVCFLNRLEGVERDYLDANYTNRLAWDPAGGASTLRKIATGAADYPVTTYSDYYNSATCSDPNVSMRFYHNMTSGERGGSVGRNGPFLSVDPGKDYDNHLGLYPWINSSILTYKMFWKIAPGAADGLGGFRVMGKYSTSPGSDGGGGDETCSDLAEKGFSEIATLPNSALEYNFVGGSAGLPALDSSNLWGYQFAVCPFFQNGQYTSSFIRSRCSGNCSEPKFGRKVAGAGTDHDFTVNVGQDITSISNINLRGGDAQVSAVTRLASHYLQLDIAGANSLASFQAGDDILLTVVSENGGGCAMPGLPSVGPHTSATARIYSILAAPDRFVVPAGSFLDYLVGNSNLQQDPNNSGPHCYVMASRIIEFGNLTIEPTRELIAYPLVMGTPAAGGILALRVSGTLAMSDNAGLNANSVGYEGGMGSQDGAGRQGLSFAGTSSGGGQSGTTTASGAGGGGIGSGGNSAGVALGGMGTGGGGGGYGSDFLYYFGGGGGGADGGGAAGGIGGGIIYLITNTLNLSGSSSPAFITANGGMGGNTTDYGAGGGGGGSVNTFFRNLTSAGAQTLEVRALGGLAGVAATENGGGGGGGSVNLVYCQGAIANPILNTSVLGGSGANVGNPGVVNQNEVTSQFSRFGQLCF